MVDLSSDIAGPYATKLLADAGADVVTASSGHDGGLYEYLHASKRLGDASIEDADVLVLEEPVDVVGRFAAAVAAAGRPRPNRFGRLSTLENGADQPDDQHHGRDDPLATLHASP